MFGFAVVIVMGLMIAVIGLWGFANCVYDKIGNIDIVSQSYVDNKASEAKVREHKGYFYNIDGYRMDANIVEARKTEAKVTYWAWDDYGKMVSQTQWIPKKDYHLYYTMEEVAEIINKTKRKK